MPHIYTNLVSRGVPNKDMRIYIQKTAVYKSYHEWKK